jgi:hypothetical protein
LVTLCEDCQKRPAGLEGHQGIFLSVDAKTPAGRHLFRCARCQALWLRDYAGDGAFAWLQVPPEEAIQGAD